jgi:hypothetical protein
MMVNWFKIITELTPSVAHPVSSHHVIFSDNGIMLNQPEPDFDF